MRNRHTPVPIQQAGNSTQQLSALAADLFIVITVRRCWPIACLWQQKQLLELAEVFCYSRLGVQGPLVQVYGDVLPTSAFLILVPRTKVVPHIFVAASEFIHDCQKLWALSVQMQLGRYAVLDSTDPELSIQRIRPNSWPDIASWRRVNLSQRPVSVQLLAGLSPKDASVFALVTNAAAQTTAKAVAIETGQALRPILDEVEQGMKMAAGTLAEYTAGGMVITAQDEMVLMLLLQAQAPTEAGLDVTLYHVLSTF